MNNNVSPTELCWQTGDYTDECHCEFCEHNVNAADLKIKTDRIIKQKSSEKLLLLAK